MTRTLNLVRISMMFPKEWDITIYILINRKKNSPNLEEACVMMWEDWSRGYGGKESHCDSWLMAKERDWIPLPMCDLERQPWSLDRNPAWLITRLQLYEMLSRNPCRTVLAFLICRNCEMNASWTSKVLHTDSNRKLVKIPTQIYQRLFLHRRGISCAVTISWSQNL